MTTGTPPYDVADLRLSLRLRSSLRKWARGVRRPADPIRDLDNVLAARVLVGAAATLFMVFMLRASISNLFGFNSPGFDLGIFDQGTWLLSRFQEPFVTIRGLHLFGDHTSFILLLAVPFMWVFDSAVTLLVLQTVALAAGGVLVFMIGRRLLENEILSAIAALSYYLQPGIGWTNLENFHPDSFEVPLILAAFYMLLRKRWTLLIVLVFVLMLVKEDVAVLTIPLGIYVWWQHDRRTGLIITAVCAAWLAANLFVILPAFNDGGSIYASRRLPVEEFGGLTGFISAVLTHPWDVFDRVFDRERLEYLKHLFVPLGLLPLLSWKIAMVAVGALLLNLLSTFPYQYQIEYHYSTLIVPVLVVAAIAAVAAARSVVGRRAAAGLLLAASLVGAWLWGPLVDYPAADPTTLQVRRMHEHLEVIPDDAIVSAHYSLVTHLAHREEVYQFPNPYRASYWGNYELEGQRLPMADDIEYLALRQPMDEADRPIVEHLMSIGYTPLVDDDLMLILKRP